MIKFASRAAIVGALLAVAGIASATSVTVGANANSIVGGSGLDTGVFLNAGGSFTVSATGTWQNDPQPQYVSDAEGHVGSDQTVETAPGVFYTFNSGELVGEIGDSGVFFAICSSYSGVATSTGYLNLFYWDSDAWNNSGSVVANVSTVPEPANLALMALGLGAFALTRRRKA